MNKPGCFASASVFSHDSEFCRKCPVFLPCSDASLSTLKRIRATVDVDGLIAKHRVARQKIDIQRLKTKPVETTGVPVEFDMGSTTKDLMAEDKKIIATITNAKAAAIAASLCYIGHFASAKEALRANRNPFTGKKGATQLRVAMDLLVAGGFSQAELTAHYTTTLGWAKTTAESQASIAVSILTAFGFVDSTEGRYTISKGL